MADSLALIGQAKVGSARLGWPTGTTEPPTTIRANGECWGLVQDPAILQAIQDAADAKAAADTAQDAADSALTMAGSNTRVYYSTDAPSGVPSTDNAVWRQLDSADNVVGRWRWSGTEWVTDLITTDVIDNLDVGKLTVGTGVIAQLVAQHIAAQTATFQTVDIANLFATTATLSEAVISKLFADVVKARIATAEEFIGENAILTGSITAPKITASEEMSAKLGEFLRVNTRMLEADAIDGMVITGAIFQSPGGGAGFQLTENGYTSRDADGNVTVRLPADGSAAQFRGDVEAKSLTASGRVSFQSPENEIASGAALVLESGVTAPLTPPTVGTTYETSILPATGEVSTGTAGLAQSAGLWWRASRGPERLLLHGIDSSGAIVRTITTGLLGSNGIAAIGGELFVLGRWAGAKEDRHVAVYDVTTSAYKRRWVYESYGTGTYQPGIGTDGTSLLIGQCWATDGHLTWRKYNPANGALVATVDTTFYMSSTITGIIGTSADFGGSRVVVSKVGGDTVVFTPAGASMGSSESWWSSGKNHVLGMAWDGSRFYQLTAQSGLIRYSGIKSPAGSSGDTDDWWVASTWRGPSGAETTMGPAQRFTFIRRSELQLSASQLPAGATGVSFYLARKATGPSRTDFHLLTTVSAAMARVDSLPSGWASTATPPLANTFSDDAPGLIRSRSENFRVDGAGAGKWGPLTFHPDGSMTSSAIPAWVPITSFLNGCTVGDFGFVPAYRSWPDGKVELRGIVKGNLDVIKPIFNLSSAVRSAQPVNLAAATNGGGSSPAVMRVEIGSIATPDALSVVPQGVTRVWVSLDGIYYYQF